MELRDIEYFAVVAQHGNLGRAAEALGLSQPAISKCLRRLESELGAKLVKRTPRGVEVTPEGSVLLLRVRGLRLSLQEIAREVADLNQGRAGHVRIGAGENVADFLMPPVLQTLLTESPRVTLKVTVSDNDLMLPALRNGELDLIVNYLRVGLPEGLKQEAFCEDETIVCADPAHRLARRNRVGLEDLVGERWALSDRALPPYAFLVSAFTDRALPAPVMVLESRSSRLRQESLARLGLLDFTSYIAFTHRRKRQPLARIAVPELAWRRPIGVIQRADAFHSPATRRLIEILRKAAPAIGAPQSLPRPTR